jgi:hypothetical protein
MAGMRAGTSDSGGRVQPGCNVNSTFNFGVGAIAILVAILIAYVAYARWSG